MEAFKTGIILGLLIGYGMLVSAYIKVSDQLEDQRIELNVCNASFDLFYNDMQRFCEQEFEHMGC